MAGDQLPNLVLPTVTRRGHHTKYPNPLTCVDAYQMLPDLVPRQRNPLVILDWSTNTYHPPDLGRNLGQNTFTNDYLRQMTLHTVRRLCVMWG